MRRARIIVGLAVVALAVAGCGGDDESASDTTETGAGTQTVTANGPLTASVGPGFEISLTDADGADVTSLTAGTYTIEVDDQSDIHNFHLSCGSVDESTDVGGTGTDTWELTLAEGAYSFVCDPHAGSMSGSFEVSG
jgi:plastocyanin